MKELPFRSQAKGWQLCAGWETGDTGTRQTRRSPTHSRHCTLWRTQKSAGNRGLGRWCACILRGFSGPVAEWAATGLTVALWQADEQQWQVVASRYSRFHKISCRAFRRSVPV